MSLIRTPPTTESPPRSNNSSSPPASGNLRQPAVPRSDSPRARSPPRNKDRSRKIPLHGTTWNPSKTESTLARGQGDTCLDHDAAAFPWTTTRGCGFNIQDGFGCIDASAGIELWSLFDHHFVVVLGWALVFQQSRNVLDPPSTVSLSTVTIGSCWVWLYCSLSRPCVY